MSLLLSQLDAPSAPTTTPLRMLLGVGVSILLGLLLKRGI